MTTGLRARLALSFALVALLCVLMVSALANGVLESAFRRYVRDSLARDSREVVDRVAAERGASGAWDVDGLSGVGMAALEHGLIVKVSDETGAAVWDATAHNNGLCVQMLDHMAANMAARYPNWRGAYTEAVYPLAAGASPAGTVTVGYYGPFFLDDQQLAFITSLNQLLLVVAAASLLLASGVGVLVARRIAVPIGRVVAATQGITAGRVPQPVQERTGVRELDAMARSVNELARALASQDALRRRLSADMAHELRTPLAALQGHVEAFLDGVWQPDAARLSAIHAEILRLGRLVESMEGLARVESALSRMERRPVDVGGLAAGVAATLEPSFLEKGVALDVVGPPAPVVVPADADRLRQALINLLSNALAFTPPGGRVHVTVEARADSVAVSVQDTGIGISAEDLPKVFERFYRVDPSRSRATGGAGIGLSIARAIVQAHGGSLSAESAPGRGSTFTILLPLPRA